MSKYVHDTAAAKKLSVYVVMKGSTMVAQVRAHHGSSVLVNVYNQGKDNPSEQFQSARAGGGGYDRFTAALSGMEIDGHKLTDNCGGRIKLPEGQSLWPRDHQPAPGYYLANWSGDGFGDGGYQDCYRMPGLRYLEAIGYTVTQVL
jgi:hypothetical protein